MALRVEIWGNRDDEGYPSEVWTLRKTYELDPDGRAIPGPSRARPKAPARPAGPTWDARSKRYLTYTTAVIAGPPRLHPLPATLPAGRNTEYIPPTDGERWLRRFVELFWPGSYGGREALLVQDSLHLAASAFHLAQRRMNPPPPGWSSDEPCSNWPLRKARTSVAHRA